MVACREPALSTTQHPNHSVGMCQQTPPCQPLTRDGSTSHWPWVLDTRTPSSCGLNPTCFSYQPQQEREFVQISFLTFLTFYSRFHLGVPSWSGWDCNRSNWNKAGHCPTRVCVVCVCVHVCVPKLLSSRKSKTRIHYRSPQESWCVCVGGIECGREHDQFLRGIDLSAEL